MDQIVINWLLGGVGAISGFLLKVVWEAIKDLQTANKDLQTADKELVKRVSEIEVLVAGNYIKRDEFCKAVDAIFEQLRRIEDKLDKKVDK